MYYLTVCINLTICKMIRYLFVTIAFVGFLCNSFVASATEEKKEILIVGENNFPPFSYLNSKGKCAGFSIDLTEEIMRRLGYRYKINLTKWKSATDSLVLNK